MGNGVIHLVSYASQPDLQIDCDQSWTTPAGSEFAKTDEERKPGIFLTSDGRRYTFNETKVTCEACLARMAGHGW